MTLAESVSSVAVVKGVRVFFFLSRLLLLYRETIYLFKRSHFQQITEFFYEWAQVFLLFSQCTVTTWRDSASLSIF